MVICLDTGGLFSIRGTGTLSSGADVERTGRGETFTEMENSRAIIDRYLHLMQEMLISSIYQDRAIDPWSHPTFNAQKRDGGFDWPQQALTMIGRVRLRSLRECCEVVLRQRIQGDFVETGIWRGGACIMMAAVLAAYDERQRKVWGFDSFEGLPPPNAELYPNDRGDRLHQFRQLAVSLEEVTENFRRVGVCSDQVQLVKGWFKDTVPAAGIEKIAVLRPDGDLYESTIQFVNTPREPGSNDRASREVFLASSREHAQNVTNSHRSN